MHKATEQLLRIKGLACYLLGNYNLGNSESQVTLRICSLVDAIILNNIAKDAKKENMTLNTYMKVKTTEINQTLKSLNTKTAYHKSIAEIINIIESLDFSEEAI